MTEASALGNLAALVEPFAEEISAMLAGTLNGLEGTVEKEFFDGERAVITLRGPAHGRRAIARVAGRRAATVFVSIGCRLDSARTYLAVTKSTYGLYAYKDDQPLFRLEYIDDMRSKPICHWQVHAERGALSHLLTLSGRERPHMLSALHLPVGGARLRPCLEDFVQFAIDECGVDATDGYMAILEGGRERWRRRQIATAVRDVPDEAARVLTSLGYSITPPDGGVAPVRLASLTRW